MEGERKEGGGGRGVGTGNEGELRRAKFEYHTLITRHQGVCSLGLYIKLLHIYLTLRVRVIELARVSGTGTMRDNGVWIPIKRYIVSMGILTHYISAYL